MTYFQTPLATVIIGKEGEKFICNPSNEKLNNSSLELIISATEGKITMLDGGAQEISEGELERAIEFAQKEIQLLIGFFQHIANSLKVKKKEMGEDEEENIEDKWLEEKANRHLGKVLLTQEIS